MGASPTPNTQAAMHRACGPRALASSACTTTTCRPLLAVAPHSSTCAAHSRATAQPAVASTSAISSTSCSYSPHHHHHQPHHLARPRRWRTLARSAGGDGSQGEVKQLGPISVPGLIPQGGCTERDGAVCFAAWGGHTPHAWCVPCRMRSRAAQPRKMGPWDPFASACQACLGAGTCRGCHNQVHTVFTLHHHPPDMTLEVKAQGEGGGVEYDEATKTLRFPLSVLEGSMEARRSRLVVFTCDKCGAWGEGGRGLLSVLHARGQRAHLIHLYLLVSRLRSAPAPQLRAPALKSWC